MNFSFNLIVLFALLSMAAIVIGQTTWPPPANFTGQLATWTRVMATGAIPPREYQTIVHDFNFNRLIIYGGRTATGTALNDLWVWSLPSRRFIELNATNTGPVARSHHVAGIDMPRFRMLVFGGKDQDGNALDDLWQLSLLPGREAWTRLTSPGPSARWGASGGIFIGSALATGMYVGFGKSGFSSQKGDVWRYDLTLGTWRDVTGDRGNLKRFVIGNDQKAPSPRHSAQASLLGPDTMMIYGGCASGGWGACPQYDAWEFVFNPVNNETTWLKDPGCPARSYNGQAAPYPGTGSLSRPREEKFMVFGGYAGSLGGGFRTEQIFEVYDTASNLLGEDRWTLTQLQTVTTARLSTPGPRVGASLLFVHPPNNGQSTDFLILFGGRDNNTIVRSDMWYLEGQALVGRRFRCSRNTNVRMIHGILMFISFGIFFPSMLLLARFGKKTFLPAIVDRSPWLWGHAIVNIIGSVITIPALVIVIVAVNSGSFTAVPHAYLGIIIFAMVIFNPIWGAFKPDKEADSRPGWSYVHMWVGRIAIIVGFINMLLGILMIRASTIWFALYIVFVFIYLFTYIALDIMRNRREGISCAEALSPKYRNEKFDY